MREIIKELKQQSKGERWYKTSQEIKKAKLVLSEEIVLERQAEINSVSVGIGLASWRLRLLHCPLRRKLRRRLGL